MSSCWSRGPRASVRCTRLICTNINQVEIVYLLAWPKEYGQLLINCSILKKSKKEFCHMALCLCVCVFMFCMGWKGRMYQLTARLEGALFISPQSLTSEVSRGVVRQSRPGQMPHGRPAGGTLGRDWEDWEAWEEKPPGCSAGQV